MSTREYNLESGETGKIKSMYVAEFYARKPSETYTKGREDLNILKT